MLIELTNRCFENCTHCMVDANENGEHMSSETMQNSVHFINALKPWVVILSGGEISTIPNFREVITKFIDGIKHDCMILLQSNGTWIFDELKTVEMKLLLLDPRIHNMQVSTNSKYYTSYEKIMKVKDEFKKVSDKIEFSSNWQGDETNMVYLGRAKNIMTEADVKGKPGCGAILSIAKQLNMISEFSNNNNEFIKLIKVLEMKGYFCKPMVSANGSVHISETPYCTTIFNVNNNIDWYNNIDEYLNNMVHLISNMIFCNKCKARKNVDPKILNALNL